MRSESGRARERVCVCVCGGGRERANRWSDLKSSTEGSYSEVCVSALVCNVALCFHSLAHVPACVCMCVACVCPCSCACGRCSSGGLTACNQA